MGIIEHDLDSTQLQLLELMSAYRHEYRILKNLTDVYLQAALLHRALTLVNTFVDEDITKNEFIIALETLWAGK